MSHLTHTYIVVLVSWHSSLSHSLHISLTCHSPATMCLCSERLRQKRGASREDVN